MFDDIPKAIDLNGPMAYKIMRYKSYLGLFLFFYLKKTHARSPIGYEAVVVLVAIELFFAFAVGITCILFSLNMFRALNRSPEMYGLLPTGDFPRPLNRTPQTGIYIDIYIYMCIRMTKEMYKLLPTGDFPRSLNRYPVWVYIYMCIRVTKYDSQYVIYVFIIMH